MGERDEQSAEPVAVVATSHEVAQRAARDAGLERGEWFAATEVRHAVFRRTRRYVLVVEPAAPAPRLEVVGEVVEVFRRHGAVEWTPPGLSAPPGRPRARPAPLGRPRFATVPAGIEPDDESDDESVAWGVEPPEWSTSWAPPLPSWAISAPPTEHLYPDLAAFGALAGLDVPSALPAERFYLNGPVRAVELDDERGGAT